MKITTITVARLINTGNFENTRFEATAELADGDSLWQASATLCIALEEMAAGEYSRRYPDLQGGSPRAWGLLERTSPRD